MIRQLEDMCHNLNFNKNEAIELMKKRMKTGQVPGETNPDHAKKYVREGSKLVKILLLFWCQIHNISIYPHISKVDFRVLVCMRNMRSKISTMFTL